MTPLRAWSIRNQRAYCKRPAQRGGNISMIGAIKTSGMPALFAYDGAINSERFLDFIENHLKRHLHPNDVLIADNCAIHKSKAVTSRLNEIGIPMLFLPPYSPELNPIEESWSRTKSYLRRKKARNIPDYVDALIGAKESLTAEMCEKYFAHAAVFHCFG